MSDYRPTAQIKGTRAARAALIASDYAHDRMPSVRSAEMVAGWAIEAFVSGWAHVPGSQVPDPVRGLTIADEALAEIRAALDSRPARRA